MMLTPDNLGVVDLAVGDGHHNIASGYCAYFSTWHCLIHWCFGLSLRGLAIL